MDYISKLPTETIIESLKYLTRQQLFNVYCVSRLLREITATLIYNQVNLGPDQIPLFLRTILRNPHFAHQVQSARIRWEDKVDPSNRVEDQSSPVIALLDDHKAVVPEIYKTSEEKWDAEEMTLMAKQTELLGCTQQMKDALFQGDKMSLVVLILLMLDNIGHLQISIGTSALLFRTHLAELLTSGRFLHNLKRYECTEKKEKNVCGGIIPPSFPLLVLNTHAAHKTNNGLDPEPTLQYSSRKPQRSTSLEQILIDAYSMDLGSLVKLIESTSCLQSFSFRCRGKFIGENNRILDLSNSLLVHLQYLQQITLSLFTYHLDPEEIESQQMILGDMTRFSALEILEVPADLLLGFNPNNPPILHQILPSSLRQLYLARPLIMNITDTIPVWRDERIINTILESMSGFSVTYPELRLIRFDAYPDKSLEEAIQNMVKKTGIDIDSEFWSALDNAFDFYFPIPDHPTYDGDSDSDIPSNPFNW